MRSFMTSFLKRLSKASWDSPSRKVTVANTLTSFRHQDPNGTENPAGARLCWMAAGSAQLWLLTFAAIPAFSILRLAGTCSVYMTSILLNPDQ
jgi:hypothetical protein